MSESNNHRSHLRGSLHAHSSQPTHVRLGMCGYLFFFLCVSVSGRRDSTSFMLWFFISVILFTFISDKWLNLCLTGSWRPLLTFPHLCNTAFFHLICEVWDVCWRRAAHSLPFQHPIMAPCGGATEEINNHQNGKINTFIRPVLLLQHVRDCHIVWLWTRRWQAYFSLQLKTEQYLGLAVGWARSLARSLGFKISSEENVPSVLPLLQIKNRRLSNYGALSPRNVSLLHFKLCSERWQTNDHFNFYQEEKHMAGANEVSSLILPLTETIWTK